jgi:hypothetical protein
MPKYKLINSLSSVITEIVLGGLSGVKNPDTGKPFDQNVGIDFTKSDTDLPGKIIGKWSGELGESKVYGTTCDASLDEQIETILIAEEGFIEYMRWDINNFRMGHGSMTTTYSDGTFEYLPNQRPPNHTCDSPLGYEYCTHPPGENKYGVKWIDYRVTKEDADRDLKRLIKDVYLPDLKKEFGEEIYNEIPACVLAPMVSVLYNYGVGLRYRYQDMLDAAKNKDYCAVADAIASKTANPGRRQKEGKWVRECACNNKHISTDINTGEDAVSDTPVDLLIGDSTCPYVEAETRAKRRPGPEGFGKLQKSGISIWACGPPDFNSLYNFVNSHPLVEPHVKNVVISIGTNDHFQEYCGDVKKLVDVIEKKFPNAKLLVVQGGWGPQMTDYPTLQKIPDSQVKSYYQKFADLGVTVIEPPIGKLKDVHGHYPVYKEIGKNIDANLQ